MEGKTIAVNTLNNVVQIAVEAHLVERRAHARGRHARRDRLPRHGRRARERRRRRDRSRRAVRHDRPHHARTRRSSSMFSPAARGLPVAGFFVTEDAADNPNTLAAFNARSPSRSNTRTTWTAPAADRADVHRDRHLEGARRSTTPNTSRGSTPSTSRSRRTTSRHGLIEDPITIADAYRQPRLSPSTGESGRTHRDVRPPIAPCLVSEYAAVTGRSSSSRPRVLTQAGLVIDESTFLRHRRSSARRTCSAKARLPRRHLGHDAGMPDRAGIATTWRCRSASCSACPSAHLQGSDHVSSSSDRSLGRADSTGDSR